MQRVEHQSGWSSAAEERANAITHGIAAVMAVAALVMLLAASIDVGDARRIITAGVFGGALELL
jgi:hemolysin III